MEYEARSIKWYWLTLLLIYAGVAIYLVLTANPLLYSQSTLKSKQETKTAESVEAWPPQEDQFPMDKKASGDGHPWPFLKSGNLNMTPPDQTRNKSYTEFKAYPLTTSFAGEPVPLSLTEDQFFLKDDSNTIFLFNNTGELKWTYSLLAEAELFQTLHDSALIYLIQKDGFVTALNAQTGRPQWIFNAERTVVGEAWLDGAHLLLPTEKISGAASKKATSTLIKMDRNTGSLKKLMDGFDFKQAFKKTLVNGTEARLVYGGNQIVAFSKNMENAVQILWSTSLPENISREIVSADGQIFAVTEAKRLYVLDAKKKGETIVDLDLDITPAGNLTYLPEMQRLAYLGGSGTLRVIDLKKKEMAWRFDLSIRGPLKDLWSSRLKGAYIQEFGMKWVDKGWTLWSPCRASQFCVYNPDRGQLIQRLELSGNPQAMPVVTENKIYILLRQNSGNLAIAHLLEPAELRKAEAEAAAAQAQ